MTLMVIKNTYWKVLPGTCYFVFVDGCATVQGCFKSFKAAKKLADGLCGSVRIGHFTADGHIETI